MLKSGGRPFIMVERVLRAFDSSRNERPFPTRRAERIAQRVNGNLPFWLAHDDLARGPGASACICTGAAWSRCCGRAWPRCRARIDFVAARTVLVILVPLISGGRRLCQLRYLDGDPLVLRRP